LAQDHQADSLPWLLIKVTLFFCWEEFYHNSKEYASEKTYFEIQSLKAVPDAHFKKELKSCSDWENTVFHAGRGVA
jgi:hypothetical protein